jgi:hypothetical protein
MLSARILKLFFLSYIPSELTNLLPCFQVHTSGRNFEEHDLSYEQWKSVLHLSTRWEFDSIRKLALRSIKPPTSFDQLLLARTYNVDHWVLPALSALCKRRRPTSVKEARQMNTEDIVVVATVREEIRSRRPFVDTSEIERRIEAAQVKVVTHADDDDDDDDSESESEEEYAADPMDGATHPYPGPVLAAVIPGGAFGRHPPVSGQPPDRPVTPPGGPFRPLGRPVPPPSDEPVPASPGAPVPPPVPAPGAPVPSRPNAVRTRASRTRADPAHPPPHPRAP